MKLDRLLRHGIPHSIVESWKRIQGEELLPLQSQAVTNHDLLKGKSLIICAPTSSGKTFCGEMAAVVNLFKGGKVVFLVPLKAIAEEKYDDFLQKYAELGIKVVISTRDRPENDRDIESGRFDLAIMIYEKFNQLLIKNLDVLRLIDLIVVDELQMIADPSRGPVLELALIKTRSSGYKPQILGLSAVMRNAGQLACWLGCELLLEKSRPVELLQGVLLDGRFRFKKHNTGEEGSEQLVDLNSEQIQEILFANIQKLLDEGEQILVFLKSKKTCEDCAFLFAERSNLSPASDAVDALSQLENTTLKESLILCLQSGVAFHNADLTFDERKVVEHFYSKGKVRVIFSTTTLSLGINLPAGTVFIETQKYEVGNYSGKALPLPITWGEYENMSGRAGRFGLRRDFGKAIVIAQNEFQSDYLWEQYVEGREEKLCSQLSKRKQEDVILDLAVSGSAKTLSGLRQVMDSGFGGRFIPHLDRTLEDALENLTGLEILQKKGDHYLATRMGNLCAHKGISVKTGISMADKLLGPPDMKSFGWFFHVLDTSDGEETHINVSFREQQNWIYEKEVRERYENVAATEEIKSLLETKMSLSPRETRLVKLSCLLCEWMSSAATSDLERKYLCRSGQIEQIARRTSWLLDAAYGLGKVMGSDKSLVFFLKRLSLQVNFGVDEAGIPLARLRVPGLGRDYIWRLTRAGFCDLRKLRQADVKQLETIIPTKVAMNLKQALVQRSKRTSRRNATVGRSRSRKSGEISLVIEGAPVKDRFLVVVNGRRLTLPAKSFKYLVKLARAAFKNREGWIHKNDFEPGENQTRYLHRLKNQMLPYLEPGQILMENNRLGSYRLGIPKAQIRINLAVLGGSPDAEIAGIAQELAGSGVESSEDDRCPDNR
jgi:helicase